MSLSLQWSIIGDPPSGTLAKRFEELLERRDWDGLLWMPFGKENRNELAQLFKTINANDATLSSWLTKRQGYGEDKTKTIGDVVKRFIELLDLVISIILGEVQNDQLDQLLTANCKTVGSLQYVLIGGEHLEEVEIYRDSILSRMHVPEKDDPTQRRQLFCTILLSVCLVYARSDAHDNETYTIVTKIFTRDAATRSRFIARCTREIEMIVSLTEVPLRNSYKPLIALPFIYDGFGLMVSILTAVRLQSPFVDIKSVTAPIPPEMADRAKDWFRRMYEICVAYHVFTDFENVQKFLQSAMMCLPEFWVVHDGSPIVRLLESTWMALKNTDDRTLAENDMFQISIALRTVVSPLGKDDSVWDIIEPRLAQIVGSRVLTVAFSTRNTSLTPLAHPRYPALAFLISSIVRRAFTLRKRVSADPFPLLLQNLMMIAEHPFGDSLLTEVMMIDKCLVLDCLMGWIEDALRYSKDYLVLWAHRDLAEKERLLLAIKMFEIRATVNVLESVLQHRDIRKQYITWTHLYQQPRWPIFIAKFLLALDLTRAANFKDISDRGFAEMLKKSIVNHDPRLSLYSSSYCVLSILNTIISEFPSNVELGEADSIMRAFFDIALSHSHAEEQVWGILGLARAARQSRSNCNRLQALRSNEGVRLSDVCARPGLLLTRQDVDRMMEALTLFQYVAEKNDDDGNRTVMKSIGPRVRPINYCISPVLGLLQGNKPNVDRLPTVERCFLLIGNYAANAAGRDTRIAKEEYDFLVDQAHELISLYLQLTDDVLRAYPGTTDTCLFALANLLAVRDPTVKLYLVDLVLKASSRLKVMIERAKGNEESVFDGLISLASKAIINSSLVIRDQQTNVRIVCVFLLTALKRLRLSKHTYQNREGAVYSLLALHNLMRNSPEIKATVYELGGKDELEAWCLKVKKEKGPLKDCLVAVMKTFNRNNPRMDSTKNWMDGVKQTRTLQEAVIALGVLS